MLRIENAIKLASWIAFMMNEETAAEEGTKISVVVSDEMGNVAEVKFVGDGLNRWESGAGVDIPRLKRRLLKEGGRIGGELAPLSIKFYCSAFLRGYPRTGATAKEAWQANPGGWNEEEITGTLEQMVADGEASFNDSAGVRFFVLK